MPIYCFELILNASTAHHSCVAGEGDSKTTFGERRPRVKCKWSPLNRDVIPHQRLALVRPGKRERASHHLLLTRVEKCRTPLLPANDLRLCSQPTTYASAPNQPPTPLLPANDVRLCSQPTTYASAPSQRRTPLLPTSHYASAPSQRPTPLLPANDLRLCSQPATYASAPNRCISDEGGRAAFRRPFPVRVRSSPHRKCLRFAPSKGAVARTQVHRKAVLLVADSWPGSPLSVGDAHLSEDFSPTNYRSRLPMVYQGPRVARFSDVTFYLLMFCTKCSETRLGTVDPASSLSLLVSRLRCLSVKARSVPNERLKILVKTLQLVTRARHSNVGDGEAKKVCFGGDRVETPLPEAMAKRTQIHTNNTSELKSNCAGLNCAAIVCAGMIRAGGNCAGVTIALGSDCAVWCHILPPMLQRRCSRVGTALLTVGFLPNPAEWWLHWPAQLRPAQLIAAQLIPAQLRPAQLIPAQLRPAQLIPAQLRSAQLMPAQLRPAQLIPAQLRPAQLIPAQLRPAQLIPAQLRPAQLIPAQLRPAQLIPAQLRPAQLIPAQLRPAQLIPAQLRPAQLIPAQLRPAQLIPAQLRPAQLIPAQLRPAQLIPAQLRPAQLIPAQLRPAQLIPAQLRPAQLIPAQLRPAQLIPAQLRPAQLIPAQLRPAQLIPAQLRPAQLIPAQLRPAQLIPAQLRPAQLIPAQLRPAQLIPAQLRPAQLIPAQLRPAQLIPAQLRPAQLIPAQLRPAQLIPAQLRPAQLIPAQLRPAQLIPAQLRPAQLIPAQLRPAQLIPAQLRPAQLIQAQLRPAQLIPAQLRPAQLIPAQLRSAQLIPAQSEGHRQRNRGSQKALNFKLVSYTLLRVSEPEVDMTVARKITAHGLDANGAIKEVEDAPPFQWNFEPELYDLVQKVTVVKGEDAYLPCRFKHLGERARRGFKGLVIHPAAVGLSAVLNIVQVVG
ncbi:unnamed protein product [Cyprideis torosa]|uniref:Uncharacterized protein n=1 Tax=Cyprideis torosa TaxID=163714 RepID=A0A7R8ZPV0_9CRUS|nr:unnamed protein product [Cyprideis torosa]CAG0889116.1 unnamed protein product [Cyprideis torosa]